jgi:ribosomal protein L7/L12
MAQVALTGWRAGFNKVKLDGLLRRFAGLGLSDAKQAVDRLLVGERVVVTCVDPESAQAFCSEATLIGATAACQDTVTP